jgi:hypothetical protein
MRILPKVGPLKALAFQPPTAQTLNLFETSFNRTVEGVSVACWRRRSAGRLVLDDRDFDTGTAHAVHRVPPGRRTRTPNWRAHWRRRTEHRSTGDAARRARVLSRPQLAYATRKDRRSGEETLAALEKLRAPAIRQLGAIGQPCAILKIQPHYLECSPIRTTTITVSRSRSPTLRMKLELRPTFISSQAIRESFAAYNQAFGDCRTMFATR